MKCTVNAKELSAALAWLLKIVPTRTTFSILTNVRLEVRNRNLYIVGSDLDTFGEEIIYLGNEPLEKGSITVPARRLTEIAKAAGKDSLNLYTEEDTLYCESSTGKLSIQGIAVTEYPQVELTPKGSHAHTFTNEEAQSIFCSGYAASTEPSRLVLNGVCLHAKDGKLRSAATDGHRLHLITVGDAPKDWPEDGIVIGNKLAGQICTALKAHKGQEVKVWLAPRNILLTIGNLCTVYGRLVEGSYPQFWHVIPRPSNWLRIDRRKLIAALRSVLPGLNATTHCVSLYTRDSGHGDGHNLFLHGSNANQGSVADCFIDCEEVEGEIRVAFNCNYLIEMLSHHECPSIVIAGDSHNEAHLFGADSQPWLEDEFSLLMPLRDGFAEGPEVKAEVETTPEPETEITPEPTVEATAPEPERPKRTRKVKAEVTPETEIPSIRHLADAWDPEPTDESWDLGRKCFVCHGKHDAPALREEGRKKRILCVACASAIPPPDLTDSETKAVAWWTELEEYDVVADTASLLGIEKPEATPEQSQGLADGLAALPDDSLAGIKSAFLAVFQ